MFPEFRKFFNASSSQERKDFLKLLDDTLFEGDLTKPGVQKELAQRCFNSCG